MTAARQAAPATTTVAAPAPIPFRKTAVTSGPEVFGILLATLLVLAAFAGLAWYARRRGWLDRWIAAAPIARADQRRLVVLEALPLSRKTTVFRIRDGEREFLVAESLVNIQASFDSGKGQP